MNDIRTRNTKQATLASPTFHGTLQIPITKQTAKKIVESLRTSGCEGGDRDKIRVKSVFTRAWPFVTIRPCSLSHTVSHASTTTTIHDDSLLSSTAASSGMTLCRGRTEKRARDNINRAERHHAARHHRVEVETKGPMASGMPRALYTMPRRG